jgi:hypothetical protein
MKRESLSSTQPGLVREPSASPRGLAARDARGCITSNLNHQMTWKMIPRR